MTSNQLAYWRQEEEKRANVAKEAENRRHNFAVEEETVRHNVSQEDIDRVQNEIKSRDISNKEKQVLMQLAELYMTQGAMSYGQLPASLQDEISELYDNPELKSYGKGGQRSDNPGELVSDWYKEFKDLWKGGGSKIIAALF